MWEMSTMERRYSVPPSTLSDPSGRYHTTEDLHAWSIYRQNLNSDFTDSALDTGHKSQPPFGNFRLRESTVQTILNHPKYGPRERNSELGNNVFTYLRFGLPRVLPHPAATHNSKAAALRNGSSGYDSSDDSPALGGRRQRLARSDPDFRDRIIPVGSSQTCSPDQALPRLKAACSEADLLSPDSGRLRTRQQALRAREETREGFRRDPMPGNGHVPGSKAGSHLSVHSRMSPDNPNRTPTKTTSDGFYQPDANMLNERFFPKDSHFSTIPREGAGPRHPHLQVRDLSYEMDMSSAWHTLCGGARTKLRMLEGLSFEVRGGEILAIMATTESEGTALLDILSNRHRKWRCRLRGEFLVNGLYLPPKRLQRCVAYVQRCTHQGGLPDMSVRQALLFTSLLQEPDNSRGFDTKSRINALLEDLGLGQVKHTRVSDLTESEKRRLDVASQLLLDTDIVLLDQPTRGMDIFDTFFLVEYLRQWAARGRIVVMTIHPPTYEIFTMISRVAMISTGRMLFFGKRRDMLPYFAYIDFPCPAYKNPSDYYLDLVTLDNLSAEAMLESSQRVENLVEIFRRRQEPLADPGPPGVPPALVKRANLCTQILTLWIRALIYSFPFNVVHFCGEVFTAALMSVLIGAIYWNVRSGREQEHVHDRLGFCYVMLALAPWPTLLCTLGNAWKEKATVVCDTKERLYHKFTYAICKLTYSLVPAAAVAVAYAVPAYSMAGLQTTSRVRPFGIYIGYMILYMLTMRMLVLACAWASPSKGVASAWAGLVATILSLAAGYTVHLEDISTAFSWSQWISPTHWVYRQLAQNEFNATLGDELYRYTCSHNPVVQQENTILMRAECGLVTDEDALKYYGMQEKWPLYQPISIVVVFHAVCLVFGLFLFLTLSQSKKSRSEKERS
ncbi:LOW QUALITY PROTEIN: ATP-binding cassette sub-family G member 8-like [Uloborus diversus]|uniref:LOW QUALITY PROTEIN: ATP-binding cassette sub-family G member 8-like n=1 Tax=Uloborus diversus TaxID=327109 RepID=UPI002409A70C|nr:LOW QUALITY PROTEIN: ATP-binding cassette sub-family G member 8-like [Uloborus diversus]